MKQLRYGAKGRERPGLLDEEGTVRDLSDHVQDIGAETLLPETDDRLRKLDTASLPTVDAGERIGHAVRRQGFWDRRLPVLREDLAHLFGLIMWQICGEGSAGFQ
ncbi:MAG: hypothetical protein AAFX90_13590 [Pseudomonadota bacterium]